MTQDAFTEPPPELRLRFDLVHVRLLCLSVADDNPVPLLRNLLMMLSRF